MIFERYPQMMVSKPGMIVRILSLLWGFSLLVIPDAQAQRPLLSPRDSVEISYDEGRIFIDYGRPSMRGRKIIGGLVPYDRWWRTGANEATSFRTNIDLLVGDSLVPAGSYTIYTLPSEQRWLLIINKQKGQWGTVYNPDLDLVRIPLIRKELEDPLEVFTITLERTGARRGILRLRWETTNVSVGFVQVIDSQSSDSR